MKYAVVIIFTLIVFIGAAGIFLRGNNDKVVKIGTNAEYPPYALIENGQITGFDIDVAKNVFEKLGLPYVLVDMPFDALLPQLQLNQIDVIAAGITKTGKRAEKVLFSKPYFSDDPLVIVALHPVNGFYGKAVVVNEGFNADLYASGFDGLSILRLPAMADALLALKSGRAEVFITALSTTKNLSEDYWISKPIGDACDAVSLAISKRHPELLDDIDQALDDMISDGTMNKLKRKWGLL